MEASSTAERRPLSMLPDEQGVFVLGPPAAGRTPDEGSAERVESGLDTGDERRNPPGSAR